MAEFCRQCSIAEFGEDFGDFRTTEVPPEGTGWMRLCEGCGATIVNETGECISPHCLCKHGDDD